MSGTWDNSFRIPTCSIYGNTPDFGNTYESSSADSGAIPDEKQHKVNFPFYHSMGATIVTVDSKRASASMELSSQESATRITNIYVHEHDFDKFGQKSFASIMSEVCTHEGLYTKRYFIQGVFFTLPLNTYFCPAASAAGTLYAVLF